jgi:zinc resistance-associated protein
MLRATFSALVLVTAVVSAADAQWGATSAPSRAEASADPRRAPASREQARAEAPADIIITESHIARLRAALKLTPSQQPHWAPVEAALSELARQQARGEAAGFTYKLTDRTSAIAATAMQLRRLRAIAMPLITSLDDSQKRDAIAFARNMGFQQLVAAF